MFPEIDAPFTNQNESREVGSKCRISLYLDGVTGIEAQWRFAASSSISTRNHYEVLHVGSWFWLRLYDGSR
jgi:hypothetical protein